MFFEVASAPYYYSSGINISKMNARNVVSYGLIYFLISLLFIVAVFSPFCNASARSWVRQSMSPASAEEEFQAFVAASGGKPKQFNFFGNLNSGETGLANGKFSTKTTAPSSTKKGGTRIASLGTSSAEKFQEPSKTARVPKSFFMDIFDTSLPVDSPYNKFYEEDPPVTVKTKHSTTASTKLRNFLSSPFQPFSDEFLSFSKFHSTQKTNRNPFSTRSPKSFQYFSSFNHRTLGVDEETEDHDPDISRIGLPLRTPKLRPKKKGNRPKRPPFNRRPTRKLIRKPQQDTKKGLDRPKPFKGSPPDPLGQTPAPPQPDRENNIGQSVQFQPIDG